MWATGRNTGSVFGKTIGKTMCSWIARGSEKIKIESETRTSEKCLASCQSVGAVAMESRLVHVARRVKKFSIKQSGVGVGRVGSQRGQDELHDQ